MTSSYRLLLCAVLPLSVFVFGSPAQELPPQAAPPQEAICGFIAGPHFYFEEDQVKQGLSVDLFVGQAQTDQPVTLRFFINEKPRGFPVQNLQIEHEKFIHVIGVRDDLREFFHIHPLRVSPGLWEATYTFTHGGNYKIWTDLKYHGTSYSIGHSLLSVTGRIEGENKPDERAAKSGYEVSFSHPEHLVCQSTNQLLFSIRDASGNLSQTENFLGAPMHLIIVKDDLSVYLHAHPESTGGSAPGIRFSQVFATEGTYKLFAQFRPRDSKLPRDEAILKEFSVNVARR
ncbi:MAG: hypothetical protein QOJ40_954 [Verrucomicrobiota bacterium]